MRKSKREQDEEIPLTGLTEGIGGFFFSGERPYPKLTVEEIRAEIRRREAASEAPREYKMPVDC